MKLLSCITILALLTGCTSSPPSAETRSDRFLHPYDIKCVDGEVWVFSKFSSGPLGAKCQEGGES